MLLSTAPIAICIFLAGFLVLSGCPLPGIQCGGPPLHGTTVHLSSSLEGGQLLKGNGIKASNTGSGIQFPNIPHFLKFPHHTFPQGILELCLYLASREG